MRRYGWERAENAAAPCYWDEVYRKPSYEHFMWFLLQKLLHPRDSVELSRLRDVHAPAAIAGVRASRNVVSFLFMEEVVFA